MNVGINKSTMRTMLIVVIGLLVITTAVMLFAGLTAFKSKQGLTRFGVLRKLIVVKSGL